MYPKNIKLYDPAPDMKTCRHILFDMLSFYLTSDLRYLGYLRYDDLKN